MEYAEYADGVCAVCCLSSDAVSVEAGPGRRGGRGTKFASRVVYLLLVSFIFSSRRRLFVDLVGEEGADLGRLGLGELEGLERHGEEAPLHLLQLPPPRSVSRHANTADRGRRIAAVRQPSYRGRETAVVSRP